MTDSHLNVGLPGAHVLFTTRHGGVSDGPYASLNLGLQTEDEPEHVAENRRRLAGLAGRTLAHGRQVHGAVVRRVDRPSADTDADGQATARTDVAPAVFVADCLPIALAGEGAVAMLHAGWRGLAAGIVAEGVAAMRALGAEGPFAAAIGPAAGPCCYEVGSDVHAALGTSGRTANLPAAARVRLEAEGIDDVSDCEVCTICDERFFSHRRDGGVTGRQAGVVWRV